MGSVHVGRKKRADADSAPQTFRSATALLVWWVWLLFAAANLIDLAVQGRDHLSLVAAAILILVTGIAYVTAQRPRVIADSSGVTVVNPLRDHRIGWAGVTKVDLADLLRIHYQDQGRDKVINSWSIHYSRRRKLAAENRARRIASRSASGGRSAFGTFGLENFGGGRRDLGYGSTAGGATASAAEAEAERIARVLSEYATAARAETVWAEGSVQIAGAGQATGNELAANEPAPSEPVGYELAGATDLRLTGWLEPVKSTWNQTALLVLVIPVLILLVIAVV